MKRDRTWNEDGARKKLLEFFEAWGAKDPATLKGRRLLVGSAVLMMHTPPDHPRRPARASCRCSR